MRTAVRIVSLLSMIALMPGGCGMARRQSFVTPTVAVSQSLVAIRDAGILRLVDPMTGSERWWMGSRDASLGLAAGSGDTIFASITTADGTSTEIQAISLQGRTAERIATLPGSAYAKRVSPDGAHLSLLTYVGSGAASEPDRVLDLTIPAQWRSTARNAPPPLTGSSALVTDGGTWYHLVGATLETGTHVAGDSLVVSRLSLPAPDAFTSSLLMAPDGRTLYVVDYRYGESIYVIGVAQGAVVRTVGIRPQETTKQTTCAASLSSQGDRLYIAANNGAHGNGIDVIDTTTMQRVANLLPERTFYCLAISPDGKSLYAASGGPIVAAQKDATLTTIDTRTGGEERTVPIAIEVSPALVLAVLSD